MLYTSHKKSASRAFDCLYDPLYTVAGIRDIQRETFNALIQTAPSNVITNFHEMFADSSNRVPYLYSLQQNPLPKFPTFDSQRSGKKIQQILR